MRKHVYVDHIAATAEEIMQNSIGIFPFPAFSRCVHVYYMHCICWRNKNQGFGLLCILLFFWFSVVSLPQNATQKLWLMEVLVFVWKKANILLNSPRSSLALHPSVPLSYTILLINTHTLTVAHSQEEKTTQASYTIEAWAWKTKWACKNMVEDSADSRSLTYCYVSILRWRVARWTPLPLLQITVLLG